MTIETLILNAYQSGELVGTTITTYGAYMPLRVSGVGYTIRATKNSENKDLFYISKRDEGFLNCLNDCHNTLFGAQYNGVDFSLGQKQRIATIRAFLKPSNCIVLDEPSSAIDPIMEKEFLDFIFKNSQSKMALIITHRMSSVKQADEMIVLDQGRLIEQGNFETLMKKQGLFYELFLKQQY